MKKVLVFGHIPKWFGGKTIIRTIKWNVSIGI